MLLLFRKGDDAVNTEKEGCALDANDVIDRAAKEILEKYKEAFMELAK